MRSRAHGERIATNKSASNAQEARDQSPKSSGDGLSQLSNRKGICTLSLYVIFLKTYFAQQSDRNKGFWNPKIPCTSRTTRKHIDALDESDYPSRRRLHAQRPELFPSLGSLTSLPRGPKGAIILGNYRRIRLHSGQAWPPALRGGTRKKSEPESHPYSAKGKNLPRDLLAPVKLVTLSNY